MHHRIAGRQFGVPSDQRRALLKGLVRSLFQHDKIVTTETRAKDVKPIAEKLITTAKRNDIHARRLVRQYIDSNVPEFGVNAETGKLARNPDYVVPRLFEVIAPRYRNRPGGYTRITKLGARRGDAAPMVLLELVEGEIVEGAPTAATAETAAQVAPRRRGLFGRRR
jgi:large subunit ribosomal protein L17